MLVIITWKSFVHLHPKHLTGLPQVMCYVDTSVKRVHLGLRGERISTWIAVPLKSHVNNDHRQDHDVSRLLVIIGLFWVGYSFSE